MTATATLAQSAGRETVMTEVPDLALVRQTLDGDVEAFSELIRRNQQAVYNLAHRFVRDAVLAEDMAQEAFLKAFRLLKGFRGDCSFSTWMYRVTCSVCLTELERRKRRAEVTYNGQDDGASGAPRPQDAREMRDLIRHCVTKLPEHYATVITLYYLREVSYDEIAAAMNAPKGTIKTWMHRARRQLRDIVERELDGST